MNAQIAEIARRCMAEHFGPCPSQHDWSARDRWDERFGLVILALEFAEKERVRQPDEFGCHKHVAKWLEDKTYRVLMHRHTGTFVASDESENEFVAADTLPLLSDALLNWPLSCNPIPKQKWVKVVDD